MTLMNSSITRKQAQYYDLLESDHLAYKKNIRYSRNFVDHLLTVLAPPRENILEIGAGQGRFSFELISHVHTIKAIDISRKEIEILNRIAKQERIYGLSGEVHDIVTLTDTLPHRLYDHIVGVFILHHLPLMSMEKVAHTLSTYLKPGGTLSFIEVNHISPLHIFALLVRPEMKWDMEKGTFTNFLKRFANGCETQGLTVTKNSVFGFSWPELVERFQWSLSLDACIERIPILSHILCPFVLFSATKPKKNR
jgi:2-polyprenyl-3-methyl-5-hydroxy-6-metoxy-1,4-benzoquinol methylase